MGSGLAKMVAGQADEKAVREAFAKADKDKSGALDEAETREVLGAGGCSPGVSSHSPLTLLFFA
jgi:Ca2+-binding EF-hand superfamily protein